MVLLITLCSSGQRRTEVAFRTRIVAAAVNANAGGRYRNVATVKMKIVCLQFAPQVGDVDNNLNRADSILSRVDPKDLDLLVLPELAFTGNFPVFLNPIGADHIARIQLQVSAADSTSPGTSRLRY